MSLLPEEPLKNACVGGMSVALDREDALLTTIRTVAREVAAVNAADVDFNARFPVETINALREERALSAFGIALSFWGVRIIPGATQQQRMPSGIGPGAAMSSMISTGVLRMGSVMTCFSDLMMSSRDEKVK